jgi:hypothetical protein
MIRAEFGWAIAREASLNRPRDGFFRFSYRGEEKAYDWPDTQGTQVAETPDQATQDNQPPGPALLGAPSRVPAILVSLFALAVIGAATANFLPNFNRFALPNFALPNFALPHFSWPNFDRFAAQSPHETASVPIPVPAVSATLKDIQLSQQQNAAVLVSLTQSSVAQQADLKKISRQLSTLAAQADAQQQNAVVLVSLMQSSVTQQADLKKISRQLSALPAQADALQSAAMPLTTSSIPHANARAGVVGTSRKINSPLPRPVGPVSVGGAPLGPAPAPGSRSG